MKLTGKCKEEFLDYVFKNNNVLDASNEVYLNALIIDFLDSVGIYINNIIKILPNKKIGYVVNLFDINTGESFCGYKNIVNDKYEATNEAIIKANDLYNESKL